MQLSTGQVFTAMLSTKEYERFVPQGTASLVEDAPGWAGQRYPDSGPVCWKCRGNGGVKVKKVKGSDKTSTKECPVCFGHGRLAPKRKEVEGASKPGTITRGRRHPDGWKPSGPTPFALTQNSSKWTRYVEMANEGTDVEIQDEKDMPMWIPRQGEELCNLVGSWRILQRVGSHRWTTDDLVTAYVASREVCSDKQIRYLDLGTGNASVLQMITWALLKDNRLVDATGIEARLEAVELARRSLSFNIGSNSSIAHIIHGDFRDSALSQQFDLITGTPPYFRVDFAINDNVVTSAVINQGGMPTARQSAPARCEFRGGIEAYCEAASRVLRTSTGRFVVCENWLNHNRVVAAAENFNLSIVSQVQVSGREGREVLFGVYVMKRKEGDSHETQRESLSVRDGSGNWTNEYRESVLQAMSIPDPTIKLIDNKN